MGSGIFFPMSALGFSLLMTILYFIKKPIKTIETNIYKYLVVSNLIGLILELLCTFASFISPTHPIISDIILKTYLVYNVFWTLVLTIYVYYISMDKGKNLVNNKILKNFIMILFLIAVIAIYVLRCDLVIENNFQVRYTKGPSVAFTYLVCGMLIFDIIIFIIMNKKNFRNKKYIPIYVFLVAIIIGMFIQMSNPSLLIMTYVETLTVTIMYHTIENPDVKMLNELEKNRDLINQSYEEKSNLLFNISQEVKEPLKVITETCNKLTETVKDKDNYEEVLLIKQKIMELDFIVNNLLNISAINGNTIKNVKSTYDIKNLLRQIELKVRNENTKNLDIEFNITSSLPNKLYGEPSHLKQILNTLVFNALKHTEKGFITVDVNSITKYDVCRLIFTIENSGEPIPIEKINQMLSLTKELTTSDFQKLDQTNLNIPLVNALVRMLGGSMLIKSEQNGPKIIIILEQKIVTNDTLAQKPMLNNYQDILNNQKVLVVSDQKKHLELLKKYFHDYSLTTTMDGNDAIEKIKNWENYQLIILEDELTNISALTILNSFKKLKINTPVVVILDPRKAHFKKNYLHDGFSDIIMQDNIKIDSQKIIDKYL